MNVEVRRVLRWQAVATLCIAAVCGAIGGFGAAISAFLGGAIGVSGALAYVWRALRDEADPKKAYRAQMLGETYKFAVVLGGFALVFMNYEEVAALPLFLGFASTVTVYWMALLRTRN